MPDLDTMNNLRAQFKVDARITAVERGGGERRENRKKGAGETDGTEAAAASTA